MRFKHVRVVVVALAVSCVISLFAFRSGFISGATETSGVAPTLSAVKSVVDIAGTIDGNADPEDTLEYTVVIGNSGPDPAINVNFSDTIQNITTFVPGSTIASPIAVNDSFASIGNVGIAVPLANGLLANDLDANNPGSGVALTIVAPIPTTSANGGNLVINANGSFTYNPAPGFTGNDSFTYTLGNGTGLTNTATVSLTVTGLIWFVDNSAASNGNGRLGTPFNSLANFNSGAADEAGDNIFLYRQVATNYTGGITLLANQKLIGQGATTTLAAVAGVTVPPFSNALPAVGGTRPTLTHNANNVILNSGNTLRGLNIQSTGGSALFGTSFSGLNASENTATATGGTAAVNLDQTTGTAAITVSFISVAASGATSGIILRDTTGTFTIVGTGAADSGGIITISTGPGVDLSNVQGISFTNFRVQNGADDGIRGASVNGFTLASSTVSGNGNAVNESGLDFVGGLTGTASISSVSVSGSPENGMIVTNASGSLTLTVTGSTLNAVSTASSGNDGLHIDSNNTANTTVSVTTSTFSDNRGDHFQFSTNATSSGTNSVTFSNNTLIGDRGSTHGGTDLGAGITISPDASADTNYTIANNNIQGAVSNAIAVAPGAASVPAGVTSGTISGNTIGTAATVNSGSAQAAGIAAYADGDGVHTVRIENNQIRQWSGFAGIDILLRDGTPTVNATITGNTIANPGTFGGNGLLITAGAITTDNGTVCAAITGNTLGGSGGGGTTDFRLRQRFLTTFRLPGYAGAAGNTAAVVAFVQANNTGAETGSATVNFPAGGGGFVGGAACALPSLASEGITENALSNPDSDRTNGNFEAGSDGAGSFDYRGLIVSFRDSLSRFGRRLSEAISPTVMAQKESRPFMPESGETVTKSLGTIPVGESVTVKFRVTVDDGPYASGVNTIVNTATVTATGANGSANATSNQTSYVLDAAPDLVVTKTEGGTTTQPSGTIVYTLSYSNASDPTPPSAGQHAVNVVLTETVPMNTTFNATASLPSVWSCPNGSVGGTSCTISIGALNDGTGGTATFAVNLPAALPAGLTQIDNTSSIAENPAVNGDRNPGNNSGPDATNIIGNWDGSAGAAGFGDWNVAANWSNDVVPPAGNNVSIPNVTNQPRVSSADVTLNNMFLNGENVNILTGRTITVNGQVTLGANIVDGAGTLAIGASAPPISRSTGQVNATLSKTFASAGPFIYTVGTAGQYSPVNVAVNSGAGSLSVRANTGTVPATIPANPLTTLQRYWTLNGSGIFADVTFNYLQSDVAGNENNYRIMRVSGGNKISLTNVAPCPGSGSRCVDPGANTIFVRNLSVFSDWTASELAPTAANVSVSGRVLTPEGNGAMRSVVTMTDQNGNTVYSTANHFGYFRFVNIPAGQSYVLAVTSKRYIYRPQSISVVDDVAGLEITPDQ